MAADPSSIVGSADALNALFLCGIMGVVGQGIRAAVGLKNAGSLGSTTPSQQSGFSAAYFGLSMMIGFIAGVLAGLVAGLQNFVSINLADPKLLIATAVSGYAGADFIENSLSIIIPGGGSNAVSATGGAAPAVPPNALARAPSVEVASARSVVSGPTVSVAQLAGALRTALPRVNGGVWGSALSTAFARFDLNSDRRIAAAIGQFALEAGAGFQELEENLRYSSAQRIHEVFPNEFPTIQDAQPYVGNPVALANRAYANKLGNGDVASGDGYRFRGRGLIQITGRSEYALLASTLGKTPDEVVDYCATPEGAAMSGCWYLNSRGCLPLADVWDISAITRKVNGAAMLGNDQRIAYSNSMLKQLGGS